MKKSFNAKIAGAAVAVALTALAGTVHAEVPGYVSTTQGQVWTTPFGICVKTTDWSPASAVAPCDPVMRVEAPVAPVPPPVAAAPEPKPEPIPAPAPIALTPPPPAPVIEKVAISSELLFEFDSDQLRPQGRQELDKLADRIKDAQVEQVLAVGHTDRIGPKEYNMGLSERRAQSVKEYLTQRGVAEDRVRIEARGPTEPVTEGKCKGLRGDPLIECLEPDRRVEIEVRGTRTVAAGDVPAAAGAGAGPTTTK